MKQVELIDKRKPREKHFLREDGTILAEVYDTDIHYLKDGKYEEIDNTLVSENGVLRNKSNNYRVEFKENFKESLIKMTKDEHYIDFKVRESNIGNLKVGKRKLLKQIKNTTYNNITDDITVEYQTLSDKVKETIVLQNANYSELSFELDTDLILSNEDGEIIARDANEKIIFRIEKPFMIDSNKIKNDNIYYKIDSFDDAYLLTLILDDEWLNSSERVYPVYVDPTITNNNQSISLYDTYIYPGDTNDVRSNKEYLKAGVEKVNGNLRPNRTLIKFSLPTIGTGSEIVSANLDLISYPTYTQYPTPRIATIHRVTADWDENTANWSNMNQKYEQRVESIFYGSRSTINNNVITPEYSYYDGNITNLVKKWYRNTPNYGVMIKAVDETKYVDEDYPIFYSKDNSFSNEVNPKPIFSLVYRNHNGVESYLDYRTQSFADGTTYINTYNGNLTTIINLGHTVGGNLPVNLDLVYNTNDVILGNETFFSKGYKLNLEQTIKDVTIDNNSYLEYLDEDGTVHYFNKGSNTNYADEDGLNLTIEKTDSLCTMIDSDGNKMLFSKIGSLYRLTKIIDIDNNKIDITLNENNSISKVTDKFGYEVNISYGNDSIVVTSPDMSTTLNYTKNLLTSLQTINGVTVIEYNPNNIISTITDVTGLKMKYEYYSNSPYRVSKVTQIGLNGLVGGYFTLDYGFDSTTIIDNKGKNITLIYNSYGNLLSENNMTSEEDIDSAYSINRIYGNERNTKNRMLSSEVPIKYIKNYLKNASFESDVDYFQFDNENITKSYSTEEYVSGNRSLRFDVLLAGQSIEQVISLPKGKFYTFSGYFKNAEPIIVSLSYLDKDENLVIEEQTVDSTNIFIRNDITIFYDESATSDLKIKISFPSINIIYIDDVQLEGGEVANGFNMIENSDFSEGYSEWELDAWTYGDGDITPDSSFSIAKFNNNKNTALKVSTDPTYGVKFTKTLSVKGKKGDLYTCSFWYKNLGITGYGPVAGSAVSIYFKPVGYDAEYCIATSDHFNPNEDRWQFFTYRSHAPEDFECIKLTFLIGRDANDFYLTNLSLYKDVTSGEYNYDDNGNLVSATDQSKKTNIFKYDKNNQLISMTNALGKDFKYEYDNDKISRVLSAISSSGISNRIIYDKNGNPVTTRISKRYNNEVIDGLYKIRNKGTNKYLKATLDMVLLEENECSNTIWKLEKKDNCYKIIYSIQPEYSISIRNGNVVLDKEDTNNLFNIEKNTDSLNGTYYITYNETTPTGGLVKFLTVNGVNIEAKIYSESSSDIEFYIELKDDLFMEKNAKYTSDGRFIEYTIDDDFNETKYESDPVTGLTTSITDSMGHITRYTYNSKRQIKSVSTGERTVTYEYNNSGLLNEISYGNKNYMISYDNFLNLKKVMIGHSIMLVNNEYGQNNGNILSTTYGNNQTISFEHDDFDRINAIHRFDDDYYYKYDNNGNIAKVISGNNILKYVYDISNRIYNYKNGNFNINYTYDSNDNIIGKIYKLLNSKNVVNYEFDINNYVTKITSDNNITNYQYDNLGRLINENFDNNYNVSYTYISRGKRATNLIGKINDNFNEYEYTYDKLNNITHIYLNGNLVNRYYYDYFKELIKEENYCSNHRIEYNYDESGNLLLKKTTNMTDNSIISNVQYQYTNTNWEDQLTKYNDVSLSYDEIGNPIAVGTTISMSWKDGKDLNTYTDSSKNLNISYKYNESGIRILKEVNGTKVKYHLEDSDILYEERENDTIYYLYDLTGISGLEYTGSRYYFVKNIHDDVIGILDNNYEMIAKYEYDSWGKLLSVKDNLGNEITDSNNIALINPIRYRSYYYDIETGLYYLNSRYYNPEWGRFINTDAVLGINEDILSYNLYAYVSNNPIMFRDDSGYGIGSFVKKLVKKITSIFSKKKKPKKKVTTSKTKKVNNSVSVSKAKSHPGGGSSGPNHLPTVGKPNSVVENSKGDTRYYGPDGRATKDVDSSHPEHHPELKNPHEHDWTWDEDGKPQRGPAHNFTKAVIEATVTIGAGYLIYRGVRMLPSLLPTFWWTIPINAATP